MLPESPRHVLILPDGKTPMAFRRIPAGSFRMGSRGYRYSEEPQHRILITTDYWLGETPVTQEQFAVWTRIARIEHLNFFLGNPVHPVESLGWCKANAFCGWLTESCKQQFPKDCTIACLPTESEWEYACRAGTESEYYTGDGVTSLAEAAWYDGNSGDTTKPVGLLAPNEFGLHDMHGNVWEWCHNEWRKTIYRGQVDGAVDPELQRRNRDWRGGIAPFAKHNRNRVVRGGSWINNAFQCRSASRNGYWATDDGGAINGLRVCLVSCLSESETQT